MHVGEDPQHLLHRLAVFDAAVDRLGVSRDMRDHLWMVDCVDRREIADVECVIAFPHECEQMCGSCGSVGHGGHVGSFPFMRDVAFPQLRSRVM